MRIAVLAGLAAACLGAGAQAQPADRAAKLVVGWGESLDTLNPATTGNRDVGPIDANIFDTLVWLTPDLTPTPHLATGWTVSPDGKTYSFTLRQDVTFHDGTPFNADAVVANFAYINNPDTQAKITLSLLGPCNRAKATGPFTVEIACTAPYAPLLAQLGEPYLGMQSPKAIQTWGRDLGLHPTGTGPFSFVSYAPNQSVVLKRNDAYHWGAAAVHHDGPPDLAEITFQIVTSPQARVNQFQSGQSQAMQETPGVFWNALGRLKRYTSIPVPISGMGIFAPINTQAWPTNDPAVRKAILYAVDKKGVIELADAGVFAVSNTPLVKGMLGYDPALEDLYPYDPDKAAATLKAAGWSKPGEFWQKDGRTLSLKLTAIATSTEYPLLAQALQGYLRKAGMDAQVEQLASPAWLAANIKGDMSMTPLQYIGVDPDALHLWFLPGQYFNWSHVGDPALGKLITAGQQELDAGKRAAIYRQIQRVIMENAMEMPIHENVDLVMTSPKLIGLTYSGGGFEYFGAAAMRP